MLSSAVKDALPEVKLAGLDTRGFWTGCSRRAFIARALAERSHPSSKVESFTAGLLQDMAVPVLASRRGEDYTRVISRYRAGEGDLDQLERDELGMDHAQVGGQMARQWKLPASLVAAVQGHHGAGPVDDAVAAVAGIRFHDEQSVVEETLGVTGIEPGLLTDLVQSAFESADDFARKM